MRLLKRLRSIILIATILAVINLLLYGIWVRPMTKAVAVQQSESQSIRRQLQQMVIYQRQQDVVDRVAQTFAARKDLASVISQVSSLGRRAGVSMPEMNFEPATIQSRQWGKMNLHFNASGRYTNIRRFLAALEGSDRLFVIESLSLQKGSRASDVIARLVVGVYITEE